MVAHLTRLGILALCLTLAGSELFASPNESAQIETFVAPSGEGFFALHLSPDIAQPLRHPYDLVVLCDTSASQAGSYREKMLLALDGLLGALGSEDRVELFAVDVTAVSLSNGFVSPESEEMSAARARLVQRVPLGSTDMPGALEAALAAVVNARAAQRDHAAIYLGDGMNAGALVTSDALRDWADKFATMRTPISSFLFGPRVNVPLLGSLAKTTGGFLMFDEEGAKARQVGQQLADAARGDVIWPKNFELPKGFRSAYYRGTPPLRFDRDTVVLGVFQPDAAADVASIRLQGSLGHDNVSLTWRATRTAPSEDHSYLVELIRFAERDGGVSLPNPDGAALEDLRHFVNARARALIKLGQQAVAMGDAAGARQLADEAARTDPTDPGALVLRCAAARVASTRTAPPGRSDVSEPTETDARPAEPQREAADGELLNDVERQQRLVEGFLRAEVRNTLKNARTMLGTDAQGTGDMLKLALEKVRSAAELTPAVRAQLIDQLESALQAASRQIVLKSQIDLQREQIAAEGEARERINRELFLQEQKVDQLMARFNALMDEERYRDAEALADIAEELEPGRPGLRGAELTARMVGYTADMNAVRDMRQRGFVDSLYQVELSHVPTADEPPILYPDPEVWQLLTERRKKYKAVDVKEYGPNEQAIMAALDEKTELDFAEQPLSDVVDYLRQRHEIEIQLDQKALTDAGVGSDTPITRAIKGITLRSALKLILSELDLTYVIKNEVLMITSKTEAENLLVTKVYPVGDLVIPIATPRMGFGGGGRGMF